MKKFSSIVFSLLVFGFVGSASAQNYMGAESMYPMAGMMANQPVPMDPMSGMVGMAEMVGMAGSEPGAMEFPTIDYDEMPEYVVPPEMADANIPPCTTVTICYWMPVYYDEATGETVEEEFCYEQEIC